MGSSHSYLQNLAAADGNTVVVHDIVAGLCLEAHVEASVATLAKMSSQTISDGPCAATVYT